MTFYILTFDQQGCLDRELLGVHPGNPVYAHLICVPKLLSSAIRRDDGGER
jgi:hypothetical protein